MMTRILIADDDLKILTALKLLLKSEGFNVTVASTPQELLDKSVSESFDLVLTDLNFTRDTTSGKEGLELIETLRSQNEFLPIVGMTGWATVEIAVEALKLGANDFIQKPWENERLLTILHAQLRISKSELKGRQLREENQLLRNELSGISKEGVIVESEQMKHVIKTIERLSKSDMNILLTGENGTGKSMLAEYLHRSSRRNENAFISVNMGAIPETLFESEMFGHVKGAFTDARKERLGRFELANEGTLFLDEIANIPVSQQSKLLRVLEEQKYEKVGSSKTQTADVRIVSATNGNLDELVENKVFRQDLLYRLNTVEIHIPPLRERKKDVEPLVAFYLEKFSKKYKLDCPKISPESLSILQNYHWPGNIRELSHLVERSLFINDSGTIAPNDLGLNVTTGPLPDEMPTDHLGSPLEDLEREIILKRLEHFNGNAAETAESLGLSRSAFYRRLEKFNLDEK